MTHTDTQPKTNPATRGDPAFQRLRMKTILLSVGVSIVLLGLKLYTYHLTGSSAVLSDALESIVNVVASAFATLSIWMAAKPPDRDHPYGHGKIEYFSAGFEGALIIGAAAGIFYTGVTHLLDPRPLPNLGLGLIILCIATVTNLILGIVLLHIGRRTDSLTLMADGRHILTDVYTSVGVLAGLGLVHWTDWLWLDGAIACLVGINILVTGARLVRQSFAHLMHASDPELLEQIARLLERHRRPDWVDIHQLRAWRAGTTIHIDLHLVLPGSLPLETTHLEAKKLETLLIDRFRGDVDVLIHMDPCEPGQCPVCGRVSCGERSHRQDGTTLWDREQLVRPSGRPHDHDLKHK